MRQIVLWAVTLCVPGCGTPQGVPEAWTHQELAEHLSARGTGFKFVAEDRGALPTGYFVPEGFEGNYGTARAAFDAGSTGFVQCIRMETIEDARKQVRVVGYHGFASGRFAFRSRDPGALSRIRRAMP